VKVTVKAPNGNELGSHVFDQNHQGASFGVQPTQADFHSILLEAANTPQQNSTPAYSLDVTYAAPQTL
jgi:hypothetical protein